MDFSFITPTMQDQLAWLAISGIGGAYFRAVFAPEIDWARRILQAIAGAFAALFAGGIIAHLINIAVDAGLWAYMVSGFILGSGGELVIKKLQDKLFGKINEPTANSK